MRERVHAHVVIGDVHTHCLLAHGRLVRVTGRLKTEQIPRFILDAQRCMQSDTSFYPSNQHSLLTLARQPRQLRSSSFNPLFVPSVKINVGTRAFSVAAPTL